MTTDGKLKGKKALVTGAGTGIGREVALEFARQGADVVVHYNLHDATVASTVEEILGMGKRAIAIRADFESVEETLKLAQEGLQFLGGIDCLVNNAGITFNKPFDRITPQQFDRLFHVNVRAQFFLTQRILQEMVSQGSGAICNMTSIHGLQGAPEHALYASTKGAIISFTRALAVELAHKGVRVNAIAPGWILVESHSKSIPGFSKDAAAERAKNKLPVARYGTPSDVAKLAVFLCSDDAEFIVGQTFVTDGGTTALMSLLSDFRSESRARFGREYMSDIED